jgi:hypothetical protein
VPTIFNDKVTIGDLVFNDLAEYPEGIVGRGWGVDVLDGWRKTPPLDAPYTEIGLVDGEIPGEFFAAKGKFLNVGGWVHAIDAATADVLWDLIVLGFRRNEELVLTRYESIPKFMRVRRVTEVDRVDTSPESFRWATTVKAGDPFKYALTPLTGSAGVAGQSSGGRTYKRTYPLTYATITSGESNAVALTNAGQADSSRFTVTLSGPLNKGGWRLVNETTNETIKFDIGLLSTDVLEIDFHNEVALLNGAPVTVTIIGDFFRLVPGVNVLKVYADFDPSAGFDVTGYSAWE